MRPRELASGLSVFPARTPTLPPATHTNSYALGGREVLLVEPATSYDDELRAWVTWARSLEGVGRKPVALFATHYHPDHVGGVDVLARELGVPLWTHEETARRIGPEKVSRRLNDGDVITLDGPVTQTWHVLETPGHAWGHLCLWDRVQRTLIAGDMVASEGTIVIAPGDGDMRVYLEQLGRLSALDAKVALPAHGEPIDDPNALFNRYVAHRLAREARVMAAVVAAGAHGATDVDLVPTAYADTNPSAWPFALFSLQAHLAKLAEDGRVVRVEENTSAHPSKHFDGLPAPSHGHGMADSTWQSAFVAMTFALGDSLEDARASLHPTDFSLASSVVRGLSHAQREVRARTLAAALGRIVAEVELARMRVTTIHRARIVKAAKGAAPIARPMPGLTPTKHRRVAREVLESRETAKRIVAEARAEAATLLAAARAAAAGVAHAAGVEAREAEVAKLAAHYLRLRYEDERRAEADLDRAIALAQVLSERLLGEALEHDPRHVVALARQALAEARGARRVIIDASPLDADVLRRHLVDAGFGAQSVEVRADPALSRGSLRLTTSLGNLDAQLHPQLERLARALRDTLQGA